MHQSIGVKDCLSARGILIDNICPIYQDGLENILHALRDCPSVKAIWYQLGVQPSDPSFFSENLKDWLYSNNNADPKLSSGQIPWFQVFLFAIWLIWKSRNLYIFKARTRNPNIAKEILAQAMEYNHYACNLTAPKKMIWKNIRWEKPNAGWMKLNIDESSFDSLGLAGGGGVLRDEEGKWVIDYARKIGTTNSFLAELWALRDGLFLCLQAHVQAVIIEMDAKTIVDAFSHQSNSNVIISSLMDDCRYLVTQIPQVRFRHVYREANRCADHLAKLGSSMDVDFAIFSCPLVDILPIFETDCHGLFVRRLCSEPVFVC